MAYFLMYIPSNFLSIYVMGRFGVKISIVIGTLLFMLGAWLRLFLFFSGDSFTVFYIGTFLAAGGQPLPLFQTGPDSGLRCAPDDEDAEAYKDWVLQAGSFLQDDDACPLIWRQEEEEE
jgi:hypothetical protein